MKECEFFSGGGGWVKTYSDLLLHISRGSRLPTPGSTPLPVLMAIIASGPSLMTAAWFVFSIYLSRDRLKLFVSSYSPWHNHIKSSADATPRYL